MSYVIRQIMAVNCKIYRRSDTFMVVLPSEINVYIEQLKPKRVTLLIDRRFALPLEVMPRYDVAFKHYAITLPKKLNRLWESLWMENKTVDVILEVEGDQMR